jgi:hypothetical protein
MAKSVERVVYHVTTDASAEKWVVTQEHRNLRREFNTKDEAEKFARYRARLNELSQVKVPKRDGNMDYETTYGEDPRDIRG